MYQMEPEEEDFFQCDVCPKSYMRKTYFLRHLASQDIEETDVSPSKLNKGSKKLFDCDGCSRKFTGKVSLKLHQRCHTGETPYQCEVCGEMFSWVRLLQSHCKIHEHEKKLECDLCLKKFSSFELLREHKKDHADKTFPCKVCSKRFSRSYLLKVHFRTHTGERPYVCEFCPKTFSRQHMLDLHVATHTKRRLFQCDLCTKMYKHPKYLNFHRSTHHAESKPGRGVKSKKKVQCVVCKQVFIYRYELVHHSVLYANGDCLKAVQESKTPLPKKPKKKSFCCDTCSFPFFSERDFNRHKKMCFSISVSNVQKR